MSTYTKILLKIGWKFFHCVFLNNPMVYLLNMILHWFSPYSNTEKNVYVLNKHNP